MTHLLIDGGHLIRRVAYTAQGSLRTSSGEPSGIAHGFFSSLIYLSKLYKGNAKALVAFDSGKSEFRSKIYPDYKSQREDITSPDYTGPDIHTAKKYIFEVLNTAGIPCFMSPGIEADDFIAALSFLYPEDSVIISSDRDFLQLITETVKMYDPIRKITYDLNSVVDGKYDRECWLDQLIFHISICGDKDEVPQVCKGLGYERALPFAKALSYGCPLPNNKYTDTVLNSLDDIERNISLFDLRVSTQELKEVLMREISSFSPPEKGGIELEMQVYSLLSKWELKSVSKNVRDLLSLRFKNKIVEKF